MSSAATFEQFIRFTTDSVGLERIFRLLQSIVQIILSYSFTLNLLLSLLQIVTTKPPQATTTLSVLRSLHQRLNLARRFLRPFRFLDSFHTAQKLYTKINLAPTEKRKPSWVQTEQWIDFLSHTFNGMWFLLDTTTIIDALQIENLHLWTPEWERAINIEAQRFWLFALTCGVFSGLLKMLYVLAYTPIPVSEDDTTETETEKPNEYPNFDMEKELQRLRRITKARKKGRILWKREVRLKLRGLGRTVVANAFDILVPGSIIGWIGVSPGTVGLAMFLTTVLTGMGAWERCGREVLGGK